MKKLVHSFAVAALCGLAFILAPASAQVPQLANYQGRVAVGGVNFSGAGSFKFALVDNGAGVNVQAAATAVRTGGFITSVNVTTPGAGYVSAPAVSFSGGGGSGAAATALVANGAVTAINLTNAGSGYTSTPGVVIAAPPVNFYTTYWSNDNTSNLGSQPAAAVALTVTNGLYSVLLGDTSITNMAAIPASVGANADVRLRVWFNDGVNGFQQLSPDQRLAPSGYQAVALLNAATNTFTGTQKVSTTFTVEARPGSTGTGNNFIGTGAGAANTSGMGNTFIGLNAGTTTAGGNSNTFVGQGAGSSNNSGGSNIAIGTGAGSSLTTGSNNIDIGNVGSATESATIRIGTTGTQTTTFIAGISGVTVSGGAAVSILANGQLGTITSSRRFKDDIQDMAAASECLLSLRPVTFRYKPEFDPKGIPQWGLIAEEVSEVNPDLVVRDDQGVIQTVRYEQVNAMLLNEFLKEHHRVTDLKTKQEQEITARDEKISTLEKRLAELEAKDRERDARVARLEQAAKPAAHPAVFNNAR